MDQHSTKIQRKVEGVVGEDEDRQRVGKEGGEEGRGGEWRGGKGV